MRIATLLWIPVFAATITACSLFKPGKTAADKKAPDGPELIGRIASIPADKRFVLIQSYGSRTIETGTILTTRGVDERTANLLVTGEALSQFAAADVQSGSVEIGDAVYSLHQPKSAGSTPSAEAELETPENQQETKNENVQKNN